MNEYVILVMTIVALCAVVCAVSVITSAVENIRIAKHTGRDPRGTNRRRANGYEFGGPDADQAAKPPGGSGGVGRLTRDGDV